jgi:hypothetical protein
MRRKAYTPRLITRLDQVTVLGRDLGIATLKTLADKVGHENMLTKIYKHQKTHGRKPEAD